jgi:predicted amidohydrolase
MSGSEIVLRGGRVIDPESGFDAVADVAIGEGRVMQIGAGLPAGPTDVDVAGLVVTAGFVDLHSHVTGLAGLRLQALDGVTTALELEAGAMGYRGSPVTDYRQSNKTSLDAKPLSNKTARMF